MDYKAKNHYLCVTMTIQEAQARVDAWIKQYGVRYFSEFSYFLNFLSLLWQEKEKNADFLIFFWLCPRK